MSVLHEETKRLQSDYPHLAPEFEGGHGYGSWECHLMTETRLFGLYGIVTGEGGTRLEALLDARTQVDRNVAEAAARKADAAKREAEEAARKKALDDAAFETI